MRSDDNKGGIHGASEHTNQEDVTSNWKTQSSSVSGTRISIEIHIVSE
jgi:hypothetical protein